MQKRSFTVVRHYKASPELVFRAWTEPDLLGWFFNPAIPLPSQPTVDLRVGGEWRQEMLIDASTRYVTGGIYREISPGERLQFWWGAVDGWPKLERDALDAAPLCTVTFAPDAGGTRMEFRLDLPPGIDDKAAEAWLALGVEAGWTATIDRLQVG